MLREVHKRLALTSSGPAFVAVVAEAMADGAVAAGLSRDQALHLTHRTMAGSAALLQDRQLHPAQLKDMVSSPGGTTIAGLRRLEQAGLRSALIEAVLAAAERSRELACPQAASGLVARRVPYSCSIASMLRLRV